MFGGSNICSNKVFGRLGFVALIGWRLAVGTWNIGREKGTKRVKQEEAKDMGMVPQIAGPERATYIVERSVAMVRQPLL